MATAPAWTMKVLMVLGPLTGALMLIQFGLGLWTNVYATAAFTSNSSSPALDAHYNVGFILGILTLVMLVVALISRRPRNIVFAAVIFACIVWAGEAGAAYVATQPNPPIYSFEMGLAFLIAWTLGIVNGLLSATEMRAMRAAAAPPTAPPASS